MWGTRYQVYDRRGALRYAEDSASNERTEYIQLSGQLVAERTRALNASAATVAYLHSDHRGTPSVKTASNRDVIYRSWNDAYGEPHDHLWRDGPGFTGHAMDAANQLVYMQQRYHDPETGFISPDPVAADHGSFNRYWYANNNPYTLVDPDGRFPGGREFEMENKRLGVQPPPRDANDWLGPAIGGALTAMIAAPVAGFVYGAAISNPVLTTNVVNAIAEVAAGDALGGASLTAGAAALSSRVSALHGALDPIAAGRRTTAALDTAEGTRVLASGGRDLSPAQRALLGPGEVAARSPGAHAEITTLEHAAQNGLAPSQMAVSRTICPECRAAIERSGGRLTSPTTAEWLRR